MSLNIEVDHVRQVLLNDGWHHVNDSSFEIDTYEFRWEDETRLGGGQEPLLPMRGARWMESGFLICCPLTSILAVRVRA